MIYFLLIFLALVYVFVAVAVGKVCAINSRWEKTVDRLPSRRGGATPPFDSGTNRTPSLRDLTIPEGRMEEQEEPDYST